jgi:hypothetical protein
MTHPTSLGVIWVLPSWSALRLRAVCLEASTSRVCARLRRNGVGDLLCFDHTPRSRPHPESLAWPFQPRRYSFAPRPDQCLDSDQPLAIEDLTAEIAEEIRQHSPDRGQLRRPFRLKYFPNRLIGELWVMVRLGLSAGCQSLSLIRQERDFWMRRQRP